MKKIGIIGAGSFLARNFIEYVVSSGLDYNFELYGHRTESEYKQFIYKQVDFGDCNSIKENINFDVDALMIFIGLTGTINGFERSSDFVLVNEIYLLNILKVCSEESFRPLIVYPSSRLVYKSNEYNKVSEDSPRECKTIYAVTKQAAESYLKVFENAYGIRFVILHICTPIGSLLCDDGNYGTFEIFKNQALQKRKISVFGDGKQRKTFTYIIDICEAFVRIVEKQETDYSEYNLGGNDLSLLDIASYIAKSYDAVIEHVEWPEMYRKVDGGSVVFDSTRFDNEFNLEYSDVLKQVL